MQQPDYPEPLDAFVRKMVAWFDENRLDAWREREAIMAEGNPGMDRRTSERLATLDILATYGLPCPVHLLRVEMAGATDWVLTTDVEAARATLDKLGAKHIVELPVDAVVRQQFGDLAVLGTPPW